MIRQALVLVLACWAPACHRAQESELEFQSLDRIIPQLTGDHFIGRATDLVQDGQGRFYVADAFNHRIWILDSLGREVGGIGQGGEGPGELREPMGIAIHGDTLAVLEGENPRISFFELPAGRFVGAIPQRYGMPSGIAFSRDGRRIVVSHSYGAVLFSILDRQGNVLGAHGAHPTAYYVVPVLVPGGHMSVGRDDRILYSMIRDYEVLEMDWSGSTIRSFKNEPPGYRPLGLESAESREDVMNRVRDWTPLGRPLDLGCPGS